MTRWAHYVGTPLIVWALLLATTAVAPLAGPVALGALLVAWYLRLDPIVGLAAGLEVAALVAAAWFGSTLGLGPVHAAGVLVVVAAAQNVSHSVEPVPPALTGRGFEPLSVYWSRATGAERVRLLLLNGLYLPLELVSAPRLFPVHTLRALRRLGLSVRSTPTR